MAFSQALTNARHRTRGTDSVITYTSDYYEEQRTTGGNVCGYGESLRWGKAPIKSDRQWQTVRDYVSSNFRKRIANGEIINNPYQSEKVSERFPQPVHVNHEMIKSSSISCSPSGSVKNKTWLHGPITPSAPATIGLPQLDAMRNKVINLAVTQAHANVDVSSMMALASAAESRKTVDSLVDISGRAVSIFRNVRKLNFRALRKEISPTELSDRYMEARYALRPMAYDAYGIYSYAKAERENIRRTFRGYASDSLSVSDKVTSNQLWSYTLNWGRKCEYQVSAHAGVLCDVNITSLGLAGVDQIAETAWELVPFSFVADWFANIGDTIAAWTPNVGVRQRASWVTVRETRTFTNSLTGATSNYSSLGYASGNLSVGTTAYEKHDLLVERIVSPLLSPYPRLDISLDTYKLTDLGIMLRNIFK